MNNTLTWKEALAEEKQKKYFKDVLNYVDQERTQKKIIYPKNSDIFNAFLYTPLETVKVVILGQDPYHGPNQAHGLCFSVLDQVDLPPSLKNIFKEIKSDLNKPIPTNGNLERWARQGVLLLNAVLTVRNGEPQSHANIGWETFTDKVTSILNEQKTGLVFLLWGASAQKKGAVIDPKKHFILTAPHPSPLSASRGFLGCKHFSKTNEILVAQGKTPIEW